MPYISDSFMWFIIFIPLAIFSFWHYLSLNSTLGVPRLMPLAYVGLSSCQDGVSFSKTPHSLFSGLLSEGLCTLILFLAGVYILRLVLSANGVRFTSGESLLKGLSLICMMESKAHLPNNSKVEGPFIWSIFLLILGFNILGLVPGSFVFSAQLYFVFPLALVLWLSLVVKGFWEGRLLKKSIFLSSSIPRPLAYPFMLLELLGHVIRPLTLSARLSVNIMAGHILFKTLLAASYKAFLSSVWMGLGVFSLAMLFFVAELAVCFIQAYVFFILLSVYMSEYSAS